MGRLTAPRGRAITITAAGGLVIAVGLALIYLPLGVIAAGIVIGCYGLLGIDV
jgi:hypothetical protein